MLEKNTVFGLTTGKWSRVGREGEEGVNETENFGGISLLPFKDLPVNTVKEEPNRSSGSTRRTGRFVRVKGNLNDESRN